MLEHWKDNVTEYLWPEWLPTHLSDSQDGHSEDEGDGPGDHVEVGGPTRQRLLGGAQSFEGRVPGIGEHDKPNHAWHQRVVNDDEDSDAGQRLWWPVENNATGEVTFHCFFSCFVWFMFIYNEKTKSELQYLWTDMTKRKDYNK